jgi:hypothetical protein
MLNMGDHRRFYLKNQRFLDYTLHRAFISGVLMIRALVFIISLLFMISIGLLTCNHSSTAGNDHANQPPSIQRLNDRTYSLLSSTEEEIDVEPSVD